MTVSDCVSPSPKGGGQNRLAPPPLNSPLGIRFSVRGASLTLNSLCLYGVLIVTYLCKLSVYLCTYFHTKTYL